MISGPYIPVVNVTFESSVHDFLCSHLPLAELYQRILDNYRIAIMAEPGG